MNALVAKINMISFRVDSIKNIIAMKLNKKNVFVILAVVPVFLLFASFTPGDEVKKIYMEGLDNMKFTVEKIEASPGQMIEVTLKTISKMNKEVMAHNFVLLKKDTDVMAFANASLRHKDNGYIDPNMEGEILAQTGMLGDGEVDTITFKAPSEPGEYEYICTFPGHYHAGMKGVLIVK